MAEHPTHEHTSFIKTPQQLIAVIILSFAVPVLGISMLASLVAHSVDPSAAVQSEEAIAKRLKPVGEVAVDPNQPAPPPAAAQQVAVAAPAAAPAGGSATPATAGDAAKGKSIYDTTCMACHATGAANAPKLGDKAAWAPRIKQGMDALHQSALKGKGVMPPKGGNAGLADADVSAAVDFMVGQSK